MKKSMLMFAVIALTAITFASCASKPAPSANQEELELRAKKEDMMKNLDANVDN